MLSVQRCRQLLGPDWRDKSDEEIELLRDQLVGLARTAIGVYDRLKGVEDNQTLQGIAEEERETVEERAAVLQFDAGINRGAATVLAARQNRARRRAGASA